MRNKKGIETGLVDFYSTIVIVLIIVIFFFAVKLKAEKVTNTITGEELGIDATRIALLYAQTPVETSKGTMTFGEFIGSVAADTSLENEFILSTITFFQALSEETHVAIVFITNQKTKAFISPVPTFIDVQADPLYVLLAAGLIADSGYNDATTLRIPLQNPTDYALIIVQTKRKD